MITPSVKVAAKAIIQDGDRFLVIRDQDGQHVYNDIPGGKIEFGETPEITLQREVQEELGISVNIEKFLGYWQFRNTQHQYDVICLTFLCSLKNATAQSVVFDTSKNPCPNEKIISIEWVTQEQITDKTHLDNASLRQLLQSQLP